MKLILLAAAISASGAGQAQAPQCPDVLDYSRWQQAADQQWDYRTTELTVIGAVHSSDPEDEQFGRIAAAFASAKSTIVFFEGPDRGVRPTAAETVKETGESGYARWLAGQAGMAARGLEPGPVDQVKQLTQQFPPDRVMLFLVLREATRLRDREDMSGDALRDKVGKLLERASKMRMSMPFSDIAGLQAAFGRYWPGRDWASADASWFSPTANDEQTGGMFLAAINRADSTNRNRHIVRLLSDAVKSGERPFVVIGRNHVPMIKPALDCALK